MTAEDKARLSRGQDMAGYRVELLRNGLVRVFSRDSGLYGMYRTDGAYHSGDLRGVNPGWICGWMANR